MATNPQGFFVITPLIRGDNTIVFVNRGWVPNKATSARNWDRPSGSVEIVALLIEGEKKQRFSPSNSEVIKEQKLLWLELPALVDAAGFREDYVNPDVGIDSVVVCEELNQDIGSAASTTLFPIVKKPKDFIDFHVTPETHMVYAATWFLLAGIGLGMTFMKFRRGGKGKGVQMRGVSKGE